MNGTLAPVKTVSKESPVSIQYADPSYLPCSPVITVSSRLASDPMVVLCEHSRACPKAPKRGTGDSAEQRVQRRRQEHSVLLAAALPASEDPLGRAASYNSEASGCQLQPGTGTFGRVYGL